jgi:hypothetical protein
MGKLILLFSTILFCIFQLAAQTSPELRDELLRMRELDQAARVACANGTADEQSKCLLKTLEEIDRPNTKRLNEIFTAHGFPSVKSVGKDGVEAFVLLLQHSPDVELRKKSEPGMRHAYKTKVISPMEYTGFVDHLQIDQGKPQIYGSNFETKDGKLVMTPVIDPKKLDERRRAMGLPPIAEAARMMREFYKLEVVIPPAN